VPHKIDLVTVNVSKYYPFMNTNTNTKLSDKDDRGSTEELKKEISIEEGKLQLLKKVDFVDNYLSIELYPGLEVEFDEEACLLRLDGPKKEVSEASVTLNRHIAKMRKRQLSLTSTVIKMLSSDRGMARIATLLEEENIEALVNIYESDSDSPIASVIGMSTKDANNAAELIKKRTSEIKLKIDKDNRDVIKSQEWIALCEELETTYNVYIHRSKYMDTWVAGFDNDVHKAHDKMKEFLDQNSLSTEVFYCQDDGVRRYLLEQRNEELNNIGSELAQYSVQVTSFVARNYPSFQGCILQHSGYPSI